MGASSTKLIMEGDLWNNMSKSRDRWPPKFPSPNYQVLTIKLSSKPWMKVQLEESTPRNPRQTLWTSRMIQTSKGTATLGLEHSMIMTFRCLRMRALRFCRFKAIKEKGGSQIRCLIRTLWPGAAHLPTNSTWWCSLSQGSTRWKMLQWCSKKDWSHSCNQEIRSKTPCKVTIIRKEISRLRSPVLAKLFSKHR